jgi:hypothetical protein
MDTTYIGTGLSTHKDPFEAAKEACFQAKKQIQNKKPNLVIVFSSIHFAHPNLSEGVCSVFGEDTNILGCSGYGVISSSGMHKYGVAVMAIYSTKIKFGFDCIQEIYTDTARQAGEKFARTALKNLPDKSREIALIFSDGLIEKGSEILSGMKDVLGRSFPIIGASSADNLHFTKTYQYFNKEILNKSLVGTILSGEGSFGYGLKHGWQPLGRSHRVTKSLGNIIEKIDDQPAIEIYKDYLKKDIKEIKFLLTEISILYPLGIYLSDEEEYLLRNMIHINNDGSLICQGDVPEKSELRIMMGTKESALAAAKQAAHQAQDKLFNCRLVGAIIFESVSRVKLFGYKVSDEINTIKNVLGENTPLIGVCTFGEQAPLKSLEYHGESHFHNETVAILTIGERSGLA